MRRLAVMIALACLLAGCSTTDDGSEAPGGRASATPKSSPTPSEGVSPPAEGWRAEVWRDVQLEVPDDWALGYAPMPEGDGALLCGIGAQERTRRPYVGRPGYGSDMCQGVELDDLVMDGEGVWFGSPLPVGEVLAKSGLRQVTVEAGSSRVTVAAEDDQVLGHVLDSVAIVRGDANGCPAQPRTQDGHPVEGYGEALSLSVCVYDGRDADGWERVWTAHRPAADAELLVQQAGDAEPASCRAERTGGQLVLLRVLADDPMGSRPLQRDYVVRVGGGCPALTPSAEPGALVLTPGLVRPWASEGVRTYVVGNGLPPAVARYFRPVWG